MIKSELIKIYMNHELDTITKNNRLYSTDAFKEAFTESKKTYKEIPIVSRFPDDASIANIKNMIGKVDSYKITNKKVILSGSCFDAEYINILDLNSQQNVYFYLALCGSTLDEKQETRINERGCAEPFTNILKFNINCFVLCGNCDYVSSYQTKYKLLNSDLIFNNKYDYVEIG